MDDMRTRITRGDVKLEQAEAAKVSILFAYIRPAETDDEEQAMCKIAADRARRLGAAT